MGPDETRPPLVLVDRLLAMLVWAAAPPSVRFGEIENIHRDLVKDHASGEDVAAAHFGLEMGTSLIQAGGQLLPSPVLNYRDSRSKSIVDVTVNQNKGDRPTLSPSPPSRHPPPPSRHTHIHTACPLPPPLLLDLPLPRSLRVAPGDWNLRSPSGGDLAFIEPGKADGGYAVIKFQHCQDNSIGTFLQSFERFAHVRGCEIGRHVGNIIDGTRVADRSGEVSTAECAVAWPAHRRREPPPPPPCCPSLTRALLVQSHGLSVCVVSVWRWIWCGFRSWIWCGAWCARFVDPQEIERWLDIEIKRLQQSIGLVVCFIGDKMAVNAKRLYPAIKRCVMGVPTLA